MPRMNFGENKKNIWEEISKDIFSCFAPTNKTLLCHLLKKKSSSKIQLKEEKTKKEYENSKSLQRRKFTSLHYNISSSKTQKIRKRSKSMLPIDHQNQLYQNSKIIRRKSCCGKNFGFETLFQKKTNCLPYTMKYIPKIPIKISYELNSKKMYQRGSISISAIVRTSIIIKTNF